MGSISGGTGTIGSGDGGGASRQRCRGVVVSFDDDRGFGFVRVAGRGEDVFLHASDVVGAARPTTGRRVTVEVVATDRGPRARRVELGRGGLAPGAAAMLALVAVFVLLAVLLHVVVGAGWIGATLGAINVLAFAVYAWDKRRAVRSESIPGLRRVPEAVLIGLAALGGSIGAIVGVASLRHKTRKPGFLIALAIVVIVQVGTIVAWLAR